VTARVLVVDAGITATIAAIYCKAWPVRNHRGFPKTAFALDWQKGTIRCPNEVVIRCHLGYTVRFPEDQCAACPIRARCTTSGRERSVAIHPDERLFEELRERQETAIGRAQLSERVQIEHALAHVGHWQRDRARYLGHRINLFDLRRCAVDHSLHVVARSDSQLNAA
jgi:hypothetical protein